MFVRMAGPERLSDEELLRRATARRQAHREMEKAYRKETAEHKETRGIVTMLRVAVVVLLVICGLLTWRLLT